MDVILPLPPVADIPAEEPNTPAGVSVDSGHTNDEPQLPKDVSAPYLRCGSVSVFLISCGIFKYCNVPSICP